jgi:amidophosphoribosyltransferase
LLANNRDLKQIKEFLEVDSIGYMSLDGLLSCAVLPGDHYCTACWSGKYRIPVDITMNKFAMEHYQMRMFEGNLYTDG